ncbi:hypothetical protein [Oceanobacillus sp. FSL H7-0719]|uniref:hypothetical protein n=1 Tax=Oceanobacillus sp. FSL H7-0719 TaxID=2954507 RepID=UPI00324FEE28
MGIKYGDFDTLEEQLNNISNTNALLLLLTKKGIIQPEEFYEAKRDALRALKLEFPELFK